MLSLSETLFINNYRMPASLFVLLLYLACSLMTWVAKTGKRTQERGCRHHTEPRRHSEHKILFWHARVTHRD